MRIRYLAAFALACVLMAGCAEARSRESKKLIEFDTGRTIEMKVGNTILVELPGNPSTGYSWEVISIDKSVIQKTGDVKFMTNSNVIGSPGKVALRFKVVGAGKATLKLGYMRVWEKSVAPVRTFLVDVIAVK